MTTPSLSSAGVRGRLERALRLDLVGPAPGEPGAAEVLAEPPSRRYLTGFLVPWDAPVRHRQEDDDQGELDLAEAPVPGDEDTGNSDPPAARKGYFPSSMGVSVLVGAGVRDLRATVTWGTYEPQEVGTRPDVHWHRVAHQSAVSVQVGGAGESRVGVPDGQGLELTVSVRRVRHLEALPGLGDGVRAVSVFLVNRHAPEEGRDELKDSTFVFQAALTLECEAGFVPRPNPRGQEHHDADERIADLQYRDVAEFAVGHGVATRAVAEGGACRRVDTDWMPRWEVERITPTPMADVTLGMEALAALPDGPAIRAALAPLATRYRTWIAEQRVTAPAAGPQAEVAQDLLHHAARAADRIESGLAQLDDPLVLDAFRLANRAMAVVARQRRSQESGVAPDAVAPPAWRPFQLAFVLMNLRAFVDPHHHDRELVDLLFFPTGGGKTEAYLGLAAFAILLRRLREPGLESAGVTVLMRYTLRLLTLDQLGRAATLVCALELIRQEMPARLGAWPFEIGLWVGKAATPNKMGRKGDSDPSTARAKVIRYANNTRKASPVPLENCPWCGKPFKPQSFRLVRTEASGREVPDADHPDHLRLACLNPACRFRGNNPLPVVAVDEPLYRRAPCFVIATVDKFAALPWTGASGSILGGADRFDGAGFYGAWAPGVGQKLAHPLAPPDLIIQDELHLISGPLGTIAGLYEAAIDALCTREVAGARVRPKIVASTATVRRAEAQIRALFARAGVEVFPPPGPDRRTSFFAETVPLHAGPGRLYLGVAAQGRSLKVVLLRTYLALLAAAQRCWEEAGGARNPKNPAEPYMTLVGYFNSLRELGGSRRIVEDEVSSRVARYADRLRVGEAEGPFANRTIAREALELTSRESTDKVSATKARLAVPFTDTARKPERVDVVLATNMISVGLDITRLGLMVALGQPKAAAEYIQATSRVGRDAGKPGLVVTLLNVHKPRDRSHYERFEAFHASFYRAVEATSVTPFAPRALDRTLPALVIALGRHGRSTLTPAAAALQITGERASLDAAVAEVLVARARAHRAMGAEEEAELVAMLRARVADLLDSWTKVARAQQAVGARLVYQRYEDAEGKALLRMPLEPPDPDLGQDGRKFKASRSMRDVEPAVNLFVRTLEGVDVEAPPEADA